MTDLVDYFDPVTEEQRERARYTVCANAAGYTPEEQLQDATTLMKMLGIFPGQEDEQTSLSVPQHPNNGMKKG